MQESLEHIFTDFQIVFLIPAKIIYQYIVRDNIALQVQQSFIPASEKSEVLMNEPYDVGHPLNIHTVTRVGYDGWFRNVEYYRL